MTVKVKPREDADLTPKEAAGIVGCSVKSIYWLCEARLLGYRVGSDWRIPRERLDQLRRRDAQSAAAALQRFIDDEADKLTAALRSLFLYARSVHERAAWIDGEGPDWRATEALHDEALAALQAAGVKVEP